MISREKGESIAGAELTFESGNAAFEVHTDPDGRLASDLVIRLDDEGGFIEGRVVRADGGEPVVGFAVVVSRRITELDQRPVETLSVFDSDGEFRIGPLEPSGYVVRAAADGFPPSEAAPVRVRAGETTRVALELGGGGTLEGRVVDVEDRRPLADARVSIEGHAISGDLPVRIVTGATTDSGGRFELRGIAPGLRSVSASAPGYRTRLASGLASRRPPAAAAHSESHTTR